jgi:hypothetical protein
VKSINETFTDAEFQRLKRAKGERSWREALLEDFAETAEEN